MAKIENLKELIAFGIKLHKRSMPKGFRVTVIFTTPILEKILDEYYTEYGETPQLYKGGYADFYEFHILDMHFLIA